ncbi:MAG TPA: hypothetical protein VNJ52_06790 [Patescibacteria group bacterium]|nr:hypothetical protein [Patescibacteria group bacterium]
MPQTLFIFDFGANEEAAQQARHRLEGWRQAFRLGDRVKFKLERQATPPSAGASPSAGESGDAKRSKSGGKKKAAGPSAKEGKEPAGERLRLMVRLEFSSHEKLSYQRWFDRLGAEPPFQDTEKQVFKRGQEDFDRAAEEFDSLP